MYLVHVRYMNQSIINLFGLKPLMKSSDLKREALASDLGHSMGTQRRKRPHMKIVYALQRHRIILQRPSIER